MPKRDHNILKDNYDYSAYCIFLGKISKLYYNYTSEGVLDFTIVNRKATIQYYDIGDYHSRKEKLELIRTCKSANNLNYSLITPNEQGDWINQRSGVFENVS